MSAFFMGAAMKRTGSGFSRNPSNRIEEEAEAYESSSGSDYEDQLMPAPQPKASIPKANSNLYDAELEGNSDEDDGTIEDDDIIHEETDQNKDETIRERIAQSQEQMKYILDLLSEDQLRRYETFRRVGLPRNAIRKLIGKIIDQTVNMNSVIVIGGIAKVFVGELVEESRKVMDDIGETGPIMPSHLLEAQRRLKAVKLAPASSAHKKKRNRLFI